MIVGHIMVAEIKLKSGVYFYTKDNNFLGYANEGDRLSLDIKIKAFFENSNVSNETYRRPATLGMLLPTPPIHVPLFDFVPSNVAFHFL